MELWDLLMVDIALYKKSMYHANYQIISLCKKIENNFIYILFIYLNKKLE